MFQKTTLKRKLLVVTLYSYGIIANASEDALLTQDFHKCINTAGAVDPVILECQGKEYERQDKRLNTAYRKLLAKLDNRKAKELKNVQRAWLSYIEAKCNFYYDNHEFSGSLNRIEASYCGVVERARRAEELERLTE